MSDTDKDSTAVLAAIPDTQSLEAIASSPDTSTHTDEISKLDALGWQNRALFGDTQVTYEEIMQHARAFKDNTALEIQYLSTFVNSTSHLKRHQEGTARYIRRKLEEAGSDVPSIDEVATIMQDRPKPTPVVSDDVKSLLGMYIDQQLKELSEQATTDPLTGYWNQGQIERIIRRELETAYRKKQAVTVLAIDIDHFKEYQDKNQDHEVGDEILRATTDAIAGVVRNMDYLIRRGGDEFYLVLPDTTKAHGIMKAEQILEVIRDLRIQHPDNPDEYLTASIGIATAYTDIPENAKPPGNIRKKKVADHFYANAKGALVGVLEKHLYRAKDMGRNQVSYRHPSRADVKLQAS